VLLAALQADQTRPGIVHQVQTLSADVFAASRQRPKSAAAALRSGVATADVGVGATSAPFATRARPATAPAAAGGSGDAAAGVSDGGDSGGDGGTGPKDDPSRHRAPDGRRLSQLSTPELQALLEVLQHPS
jgi:hypothetical protein